MANYIKLILTIITGLIFIISFIFLLAGYPNVRDLAIRVYSTFIHYEDNLFLRNSRFINKIKLEKSREKNIDVLFIGDSHFVNMLSQKPLPFDYFNISLNGETTKGVLNRFDINIRNISPNKIFILLGYNDLKCRGENKIIRNYKELINKLECDSIYILSLLPVNRKRTFINCKIRNINTCLETYCKSQKKITYLNVYSLLISKSQNGINNDFTLDGIHLNEKGNSILLRFLTTIQ